jgi:hypothetical protein
MAVEVEAVAGSDEPVAGCNEAVAVSREAGAGVGAGAREAVAGSGGIFYAIFGWVH